MCFRGLRSLVMLGIRESNLLLTLALPLRADHSRTLYDKNQWEQEYSSGHWDFLNSPSEAGHYHVIASYVKTFKPGGSVLDVGCGEGILRSVLAAQGYADYVGLDISEKAIAIASRAGDDKTAFLATDVDSFTTDKKFDVIVFNETLYYFCNPVEVLKRYSRFLAPGGIVIVSMALCGIRDGLLKLKIARDIKPGHELLDEMCVYTRNGPTWIVSAMRPQ